MAYGDTTYQINDLTTRIKSLENQIKAANPGNRPSLGPDHPLSVVTSTGQTGTADSDNFSRALNAALQAGFAGAESLDDVLLTTTLFPHTVARQIIRSEHIRPDPVAGSVFRLYAEGIWTNASGVTRDFQLGLEWEGTGINIPILDTFTATNSLLTGNSIIWQVLAYIVIGSVTAARLGSIAWMTANFAGTVPIVFTVPFTQFAATLDFGATVVPAPVLDLTSTTAMDGNLATTLTSFVFESLGFRQG